MNGTSNLVVDRQNGSERTNARRCRGLFSHTLGACWEVPRYINRPKTLISNLLGSCLPSWMRSSIITSGIGVVPTNGPYVARGHCSTSPSRANHEPNHDVCH